MKQYFWIVSFILIAISCTTDCKSCGPEFLGKCNCGVRIFDKEEQYVVNCTNQNFNDTDILMKLPPETQVLIFTGNNIPEIPCNIFGTFDSLPKLKVVDMSYNHIKEIKGKSYHHVQNVERLILNHNDLIISEDEDDVNHHHPRVLSNFVNLKELHLTNAFIDDTDATLADDLHDIFVNSNLTKLYKLHLEQNEIMRFRDRRIFCDLPQLHDLHLGDNLLIGIQFNLTCLKHLRYLDLENNNINTLSRQEMNLLDKVYTSVKKEHNFSVNFNGNPFTCDCAISELTSWLKSTNVTIKKAEDLRCMKLRGSQGVPLLKYKTSSCKSILGKSAPTKKQKAALGLMVFVTIIVLSAIILVIYAGRYKLRTKITPLIEAITKKVQYTTIKNRDNVDDT